VSQFILLCNHECLKNLGRQLVHVLLKGNKMPLFFGVSSTTFRSNHYCVGWRWRWQWKIPQKIRNRQCTYTFPKVLFILTMSACHYYMGLSLIAVTLSKGKAQVTSLQALQSHLCFPFPCFLSENVVQILHTHHHAPTTSSIFQRK